MFYYWYSKEQQTAALEFQLNNRNNILMNRLKSAVNNLAGLDSNRHSTSIKYFLTRFVEVGSGFWGKKL